MKSASAGMIALLSGENALLVADLYEFTLYDGTVIRYSGTDRDLTVGGSAYYRGPVISRGQTTTAIGLEVAQLDVSVSPHLNDDVKPDDTLLGFTWLAAARFGVLDGARLVLRRALTDDWSNMSRGSVIQFGGRVGDVELSRTRAVLHVVSDVELLNQQWPRNLFQPGCVHTLYDGDCGLDRNSFKASSTVASGSSGVTINCSLAESSGTFTLGRLDFTSGDNAGLSFSVRAYSPGVVTLMVPPPNPMVVGDGFDVYWGCDRLQTTCSSKFSNLGNFRGYPYIPVPEQAV